MTNTNQFENSNSSINKTRFYIGAALLIAGFLSPLLLPLVTNSDLPANWKTILSTALIVGIPEVGLLLAVAVLGKQGFAQLKNMIFSRFRQYTQPSAVSATRYRIGLAMFCTPLLLGWLDPYAVYWFPVLGGDSLAPVIITDLVFASSFLVLGAGFWEKIHNLFLHK